MALLCVYMQNALTHPFTVFILTNYAVFISKVKMLKKSQLKKMPEFFSGIVKDEKRQHIEESRPNAEQCVTMVNN